MDAIVLEIRDQIFDHLKSSKSPVSYTSISNKFLKEKKPSDPLSYLRKHLTNDARFFEIKPGKWTLREHDYAEFLLKDIRYCVFDLETTGGVPPLHRIIELGAVIVENGEICDEFSYLIRPDRPVPDYVEKLTGIKTKEAQAGEDCKKILEEFLEFSKDCIFVAHNALFDVNFLSFEYKRLFDLDWGVHSLCTLKLSKEMVQDSESHKLDMLATHFGFEFEGRHRALGDAKVTGQLLLELLDQIEKDGEITNFREISKYCIYPKENHFSKCMTNPDEIETLPSESGLVYFKGDRGKKIYAKAFANVKEGIKDLVYEKVPCSRLMRKVIRKSVAIEVKLEPSFLNASLTANTFFHQRTRDKAIKIDPQVSYFLKYFRHNAEEVMLTTRKLNDDAIYFGPFSNLAKLEYEASKFFSIKDISHRSFPPRSGVEQVYASTEESICNYADQNRGLCCLDASFVHAFLESDGKWRVLFFREGYFIKSRLIQLDSMGQEAAVDCFREILKSYYLDRSVPEILGKLDACKESEYNIILNWLVRYGYRKPKCFVFNLDETRVVDLIESVGGGGVVESTTNLFIIF